MLPHCSSERVKKRLSWQLAKLRSNGLSASAFNKEQKSIIAPCRSEVNWGRRFSGRALPALPFVQHSHTPSCMYRYIFNVLNVGHAAGENYLELEA